MNTVTNTVTDLVDSFQKATIAHRSQLDQITVNGRRAVWENVAEAALIAQEILKPENKADYHAALKAHDIKLPEGKKANPFGPVVKLLYGEWKADQTNVFEANRSAEKYACVFRYFKDHRDKYDNIKLIVDHIATYDDGTPEGRCLRGIEKADRAKHKVASSAKASTDANYDVGIKLDRGEVARLEKRPEFVPEEVPYGKLWFRMVDGEVVIMGYEAVVETTYKALAAKRGKAIRDALNASL